MRARRGRGGSRGHNLKRQGCLQGTVALAASLPNEPNLACDLANRAIHLAALVLQVGPLAAKAARVFKEIRSPSYNAVQGFEG